MLRNNHEFFMREFKKYKAILKRHKEDNSYVFSDPNFHPKLKIQENFKFDFYQKDIIWKRIDEIYKAPLFDQSIIHQDYIAQGYIGDCYFISALSRVAKQPILVQYLFEKNLPDSILGAVPNSINIKCGAVVVYFQAFGNQTPVLIDTLIPTFQGEPIFSRLLDNNKSGWFCLVEKAYAKLHGSYSNIVFGIYSESIYNLFGYYRKALFIQPDKRIKYTSADIEKKRKHDTEKILKYENNGCVMDSSIEGITYFLLRNPHGLESWKQDFSEGSQYLAPEFKEKLNKDHNYKNGSFWITDKDFFKYFTTVDVSKPFKLGWHVRCINYSLPSSPTIIPTKFEDMNLPNFIFKLNLFPMKNLLRIVFPYYLETLKN